MWPSLLLVLLLVSRLYAGKIWDPQCKLSYSRRCSGDPLRGDGSNTFDDWDGSTKRYSTKVTYTCNDGVGFDTTNSPAKVSAYCGKKCDEHYVSGYGGGWAGYCRGTDPADCRYQDPHWYYSALNSAGNSLPSCSVGENSPSSPPLCSLV